MACDASVVEMQRDEDGSLLDVGRKRRTRRLGRPGRPAALETPDAPLTDVPLEGWAGKPSTLR